MRFIIMFIVKHRITVVLVLTILFSLFYFVHVNKYVSDVLS